MALQRRTYLIHARDYFILRCLLETGLRVFELAALRVGDFRSKSLVVRLGKGGKSRTVLLTKATQKMIADFIRLKRTVLREAVGDNEFLFISERRKPYSTRGLRRRVKYWFSKVGLSESLSCHACRHTYVSHLMAAGVDLPTIRDNAGHSSLAITSIYSHAMRDDLGELELYTSAFSPKQTSKLGHKPNSE